MAARRQRALVRLREAVAASELPQLERGQDDDDKTQLSDMERRAAKRRAVKSAGAKKSKAKSKGKRTTARESVAFVYRLSEATISKSGRSYECTLLREGAGNDGDRNWYTKEALREAVARGLFEGAQCYADHPTASDERERPERSVRDLCGHFSEARYVDGSRAEVRAKFTPIEGEGHSWVVSLIESALKSPADRPLVGLSIEGYGHAPDQKEIGGRTYNLVREIASLGSVDLVTRAGAGGRFHRRLSESLAGARASVADPPVLSGRKLQERVRDALQRLEDGLAADDEQGVRQAFVALQEAATATVKAKPSPRRPKSAEVAKAKAQARKQKQRRKLAEATVERVTIAGRLLREVDVPADTRRVWFEELTDQADEASMRVLLERKVTERRDQLAELREALGMDHVEGAGRRESSFAAQGPPPGPGLLERVGIDRDDLDATPPTWSR